MADRLRPKCRRECAFHEPRGSGERPSHQYDVTDPRKPNLAGSVHVGGIARPTPHPSGKAYAGGPQMVEISRDGKRVYWTNSLYSTWDTNSIPTASQAERRLAIVNSVQVRIATPDGQVRTLQCNKWVRE
jgi:hypothetical protein